MVVYGKLSIYDLGDTQMFFFPSLFFWGKFWSNLSLLSMSIMKVNIISERASYL